MGTTTLGRDLAGAQFLEGEEEGGGADSGETGAQGRAKARTFPFGALDKALDKDERR